MFDTPALNTKPHNTMHLSHVSLMWSCLAVDSGQRKGNASSFNSKCYWPLAHIALNSGLTNSWKMSPSDVFRPVRSWLGGVFLNLPNLPLPVFCKCSGSEEAFSWPSSALSISGSWSIFISQQDLHLCFIFFPLMEKVIYFCMPEKSCYFEKSPSSCS